MTSPRTTARAIPNRIQEARDSEINVDCRCGRQHRTLLVPVTAQEIISIRIICYLKLNIANTESKLKLQVNWNTANVKFICSDIASLTFLCRGNVQRGTYHVSLDRERAIFFSNISLYTWRTKSFVSS